MKKSGLGDSPFFSQPQKENEPVTPPSLNLPEQIMKPIKTKRDEQPKFVQPSNHDTGTPNNRDTMVSRYHDTIIEIVRKAVKELGKEAATHRFTQDEKKSIADIIYTYKNQGVRTSENEITRIAVNFIIEDYQQNGKESILDKALKALNS